jgi:hypothetical protein
MHGRATHPRNRHLQAKRCVSCGYDGSLLRGGRARFCARCGCDLADRPARSYAEMEGLDDDHPLVESPRLARRADRDAHPSRLIERWLLFGFLSLLMFFAIAALVAAAVTPGG